MGGFTRIADALCLDFANTTISQHGEYIELIQSFADFVQFLLENSVLSPAIAGDLINNWRLSDQNRALVSARNFRDRIRKMAEQLSQNQPPDGSILQEINEMLAHQSGCMSVVKSTTGYELRHHRNFDQPEHLLVPLAESAASLLCEKDRNLVKKCSNSNCGLFFYDNTRNHTRRWCSMQTCGNRMKVNSYLQRKRQAGNNL